MTWHLRLHPVSPGWVDLALGAPLLDTSRARRELGWSPRMRSEETVRELIEGIAAGAGASTPTLRPDTGVSRLRELGTRQGAVYSRGLPPSTRDR